MEEALKARSLSSASARRKKIQERQDEREKARFDARQRALALQDLPGEDEFDSASASDDNMVASTHSREGSVDTMSEYSPMTPEDVAQPLYERRKSGGETTKPGLQIVVPERKAAPVTKKSTRNTSPGPKLQASLTNFSDFHYDRYSMIVDTPIDILHSPISETDEPETPCEIATPISYTLPRARPAVISITSSKKRRTSSTSSSLSQRPSQRSATLPPDIPVKSSRRLSQMSAKSGFLASEAAPLSVPELPRNAMNLIASASRDSLAISTYSSATNDSSQRPKQARKNSMPLLSAAFKSGHARLNSIKGLVSPVLPPTNSSSHQRADSAFRYSTQIETSAVRPRTAVAPHAAPEDLSFETVPANLDDPLPLPRSRATNHRPSTSHVSGRSASIYSMTALPTPPPATESAANPLEHIHSHISHDSRSQLRDSMTPSPDLSMRRKKSFSALRKRSESISNAIKFVKKGGSSASPKESYPPPPPVPSISRTSTMGNLLDVSRPNTARSSSTGGFMGYGGGSNTHGPGYTAQNAARKSIDLFRSFGSGDSSTKGRSQADTLPSPIMSSNRPTIAGMSQYSGSRGISEPRSPVVSQQQSQQQHNRQSAKRTTSSYSVFPSSRGEHGRSMVGLGIRT